MNRKRKEFDPQERYEYLGKLKEEFLDQTNSAGAREQVLANLANFAYNPINYNFIKKLRIIQLFLDNLTSENENLIEFSIGGLCNLCLEKENKSFILKKNGVQLIIPLLSSTNPETVLSAITTLMFLTTPESKQEITNPSVIECMLRCKESSNRRLSNLANIFLEDYCSPNDVAQVGKNMTVPTL